MRRIYLVLGVFFTLLGGLGALLPLIPTVPFLLVALVCFERGAPEMAERLLAHPRLGPPLVAWRQYGAVSRRTKGWSLVLLTGCGAWMATRLADGTGELNIAALVGLIVLGFVAGFLLTRPTANWNAP